MKEIEVKGGSFFFFSKSNVSHLEIREKYSVDIFFPKNHISMLIHFKFI